MEYNSADENSDDGLQIVIESPRPKTRLKKELTETEKKIIESVEKDIEDNLEQKAAKANLTAKHVKNILKEVVTNEHVLALVRHAENPNTDEPITVYEPKCTRAKTKQLLSTSTPQKIHPIPWISPPQSMSEVHVLFTEELQEDSSGDEYVPESPCKNSSFEESVSLLDNSHCNTKDDEEANIARRTRSKFSLSHTPLEVIEEAFIPPDITTDMYDMDCDDDVWTEFIKTFTRPLDEVIKAPDDEDHDPEYNILADEEIDEVDKEELRADRAVTVSRKEFNCLMAELFEYADIYESNKLKEKNKSSNNSNSSFIEKFQDKELESSTESINENDPSLSIKRCQIPILLQQIRQHVQMLTQNFILTYEHPELADMAFKYKEMLIDIYNGALGKKVSVYSVLNLQPAMKLIEDWENLFSSETIEVTHCKWHVDRVLSESCAAKRAGTSYVVTFPDLILQTISNSEVFIYPNLLPRIPFKSLNITATPYQFFTRGEENLIALFLEQALPHLKQDPYYVATNKVIKIEHVCELFSSLLMPNVKASKIARFIRMKKQANSGENPIKFFYENKKAPPIVHYVVPIDPKIILPPCKQKPETLPLLWQKFLYPDYKEERNFEPDASFNSSGDKLVIVHYAVPVTNAVISPVATVPPARSFPKKKNTFRKILPKGPLLPISNPQRKRRRFLKRKTGNPITSTPKETSAIIQPRNLTFTMLPDMPSLGSTPVKNLNSNSNGTNSRDSTTQPGSSSEQNLSFKNITNFSFQFSKPDAVSEVKRNFEAVTEFSLSKQNEEVHTSAETTTEKDNPDDIQELMVACSTVKNVTKKEPSGAEKKRAKMRREFVSNLVMATPDSLEKQAQKEEEFADAFFEKVRQTLTVEDYNKLIDIMGHYDQTNGDFLQLFKSVQSILLPKYLELAEEFYLFLTDIQAHKVGKLMPYFLMKDMDRFIKKMHVYFKDQPSQLKKIIKCMTDLSENPDVTMDMIKTTVLPLFKGNTALTDWFLQIFPCEKPPKMLTGGPHEILDMCKEGARQPGEDICETVILPETDDPYGGTNCVCTCHNVENPKFTSRSQHCKQCGLKFIQGKIYIQTGQGLRPAVVSFLTNPEKDHTKRLEATQRKRSDTSPTKNVSSPNKETHPHEEPRQSNESEDDDTKKKKQGKRKVKNRDVTKKESTKTKETISKTKTVKVSPKRQTKKRTAPTKKAPEPKPGSTVGQLKRLAEEQEIEFSEPPEVVELKVSSDHSGESESEFFESSQDVTNTDSEDSNESPKQNGAKNNKSWTREEDKIILQAFRQSSNNEDTFKRISEVLENRSVTEIKNRFHKLMSLLQQMASK